MSPRNTRNGASAATRTTGGSSRASSSSRSRDTARRSTATRSSAARDSKPKTKSKPKTAARKSAAPSLDWRGHWWTVPVAALLVIAFFGFTYYDVAAVQYREVRERERLSTELKSLQARNDRLREEVDRLKTPAGVEDYARSQLGLVKRGEKVAVVVDETGANAASETALAPVIDSDEALHEPVGPWTAFLDLVFGVR